MYRKTTQWITTKRIQPTIFYTSGDQIWMSVKCIEGFIGKQSEWAKECGSQPEPQQIVSDMVRYMSRIYEKLV